MSNIGDLIANSRTRESFTGMRINDRTLNWRDGVVQPGVVGMQGGVMTVVSLSILAFNVLWPNNKIIYESKAKYYVANKRPRHISNSLFDWISPLAHTKERELVNKISLNAVAFLYFLRMFRYLFSSIAHITCAILIPTNITHTWTMISSA
ncbi:hypothetical protein PILCRDRAFT_14378 [Piloderma croceum F 1598]|uniref:CSC1/OSCA1-like N-terminal transmembrane domain-containing protein n=1 Tax=Piloderma croceum (strain F 1598) TaxID=765440 RepID=A0A0C3BAW7_PILCF|nr:hypothetical protein PILCRDRAFT_14378 [Piloderma croceum F 1598]